MIQDARHDDFSTAAFLALYVDLATHRIDDCANNAQAKTSAWAYRLCSPS